MADLLMITKKNVQGYVLNYLFKQLAVKSGHNYTCEFLDKFNLPDIGNYADKADILIVAGFPFYESQRTALDEALQAMNNPFSQFYHLATFGDTYSNEGSFHSYVDEVISPVGNFSKVVKELKNFLKFADAIQPLLLSDMESIIEATDAYNRYEVTDTTLDWISLVETYRELLYARYGVGTDLEEILDKDKTLVKALREKRDDYIKRILGRTSAQVVNGTVICFTYAEEYVNEVAHKLIEFYQSYNYTRIAVFVGRHTKGDDMFSIRTSGIDAGELAYKVNRGRGKPTTATVFLGNSGQSTFNALLNTLAQIV
ncbi:DnaJ-type Zn-binding domain containing RecJ-like exonuclease [Enterococcus phage iF6]|uniref:DnaJ-type Zn-binding domain containing RecJ-like exonuclease n=1 Tax=Enterococcus phage iF6 TaxID=2765371 RepID=A0A7G8ZZ78_9CAUD|nr:DnaJ-type Zn-binding domain containing RecJ-like exonuclease [Enterococcus phage iF6]